MHAFAPGGGGRRWRRLALRWRPSHGAARDNVWPQRPAAGSARAQARPLPAVVPPVLPRPPRAFLSSLGAV